jgi:hypothetical protein
MEETTGISNVNEVNISESEISDEAKWSNYDSVILEKTEAAWFDSIPTDGTRWFNYGPDGTKLKEKVRIAYLTDLECREGGDPNNGYWFAEDGYAGNKRTIDRFIGQTETTYSRSININKDLVPLEYRKIVFIHELAEAFGNTHDEAIEIDRRYAKKYLSEKDFVGYEKWRKKITKK